VYIIDAFGYRWRGRSAGGRNHILQLNVADDNNVCDSLFGNAMTIVTVMLAIERHLHNAKRYSQQFI